MMKKLTAIVLTLALCLTAACMATAETEKTYTIGIAQFAEHSSLDNCREGFIQGLAEMGYVEGENVTFIVQNAQADMGLCQQIAQQMAQECDLVCAIATPMAQAAFNACMDSGKPVIYTAVSDPVAAMLANDEGKSDYNVTGTCDVLPVEAQLKLIRSFLPEAKKIGILYTTSETNSESQLKLYQELAGAYGFEIVATGISTGADIPLACDTLLPQVDCLTNLTDNTVVRLSGRGAGQGQRAGQARLWQRDRAGQERLHRLRGRRIYLPGPADRTHGRAGAGGRLCRRHRLRE